MRGKQLVVGKRVYDIVVIPPRTETLDAKTADLLATYLKGGGKVLCAGDVPGMIDGRPSDRITAISQNAGWQKIAVDDLAETLLKADTSGICVRQAENDKGIVYHMRRELSDGNLLFVVNTNIEHPARGTITANAGGFERWDPQTGRIESYVFEKRDGEVAASFDLPPCGSLLLFAAKTPRESAPVIAETTTVIKPTDSPTMQWDEPNVLTLDYVDIVAGKENKKNLYFYKANELAFQANGLKGNPWDCAVQFKDETIRQTFPLESGCEVSYRFTIADRVPSELAIVIERPDLYQITCNGQEVKAIPGAYWLEPSFGKIDIRSTAKIGENVVTCKASPFTIWHEIEPAYVMGDFAVNPVDHGFVIKPPSPLKLGPWNVQGGPFYGAGVTYIEKFDLPTPTGKYVASLPSWFGSVAKVEVNGQFAGYIQCQPWECDITAYVTGGTNIVKVTVFGTLKNTLGPHHGNPPAGLAWPHGFRKGPDTGPPPGVEYSTFGYGLFEPFVLKHVTQKE